LRACEMLREIMLAAFEVTRQYHSAEARLLR